MRPIYLSIPLALALILRLYPAIASDMPFSTDSWSLIRNTEIILEKTPISLKSPLFDGYNSYWPANSIFGAIFSLVTGLKPLQAMAIGIPLAGSFTIMIFYALVARIWGSRWIAFTASMIAATIYPYTLFTAGVTKETYANPLYMALILLSLNPSMDLWGRVFLFTVASIALALAHHLTPLIAIAVLSSIAMARLIYSLRTGVSMEKRVMIFPAILAIITATYYELYAREGLRITITPSDIFSAASYQMLAFSIAAYAMLKPPARSKAFIASLALAALSATVLLAFLSTEIPLVPGAPVLPKHYILYSLPYIIASPLMFLGYDYLRRGEMHVIPLIWLASILGVEAYAVFGNPDLGLTLAYRGANFLWPSIAILCAAGLYRPYGRSGRPGGRGFGRMARLLVLLIIVALSSYSVYAATALQERYMGYFWLYRVQEFSAASWLSGAGGVTIAGDVKASYLLNNYFGLRVDPVQGLRYLAGEGSKPQILFIYGEMLINGYVLYGGYGVDMPRDWFRRASSLDLIYSDGFVSIYSGV